MYGLGKPRSRLGRWLDARRIPQKDLIRESGVNKATISRLCSGDAFKPRIDTARSIIKALKKWDKNVDYDDFWA